LDSGRSFWTTKRLKTNYNIFNSILSADQRTGLVGGSGVMVTGSAATAVVAASAEELKRKVRMPTRNLQIQQPQAQLVLQTSPMTSPMGGEAHRSLQTMLEAGGGQFYAHQISPTPSSTSSIRPLSSASLASDISTATSVETKASVNDILSMAAETEDMSVYSLDLNNEAMSFSALMKMDPSQAEALTGKPVLEQQGLPPQVEVKQERNSFAASEQTTMSSMRMGSLTSVATVKENKVLGESSFSSSNPVGQSAHVGDNSMEVDALYDDVMQCVYDDVDEGNSAAAAAAECINFEPPQPPMRKRHMSMIDLDAIIPDDEMISEKPLPGTPSKIPTIITKVIGKKDKEEKERKKREKEEKEKKEREDKAKDKAREKGEKERQRAEKEKAKAKDKEERKKKLEEEKRAKASAEEESNKQSLFQRLFTRPKSLTDSDTLGVTTTEDEVNANSGADSDRPPAVPAHRSTIDLSVMDDAANENSLTAAASDGNGNGVTGNSDPTEAELNDLQQFLDSGNLDHLDNMVTEFAKQYMPSEDEAAAAAAISAGKDICSTSVAEKQNNNVGGGNR
jgi:hypothetical protein